jgi:hypothetical protein
LIRARLGRFAPKPFPLKTLAGRAEGLSYAEIRRAVDEAIKDAVMHEESCVKGEALTGALEDRRKLSLRTRKNKAAPSNAGSTNR